MRRGQIIIKKKNILKSLPKEIREVIKIIKKVIKFSSPYADEHEYTCTPDVFKALTTLLSHIEGKE